MCSLYRGSFPYILLLLAQKISFVINKQIFLSQGLIKQFAFTRQCELILIADEDCAIQSKASLINFSDLGTRLFVRLFIHQGQE